MTQNHFQTKTSSGTYFDSTPSEDITPEEVANPGSLDDVKLKRTTPKIFDPQVDWYSYNREDATDSPVSLRSSINSSAQLQLGVDLSFKQDFMAAAIASVTDKFDRRSDLKHYFDRLELRKVKTSSMLTTRAFFNVEEHAILVADDIDFDELVELLTDIATDYIDTTSDVSYIDKQRNMYDSMSDRNDLDTIFWESKEAQEARFAALLDNLDLEKASLLDVGCGHGDILDYMLEQGIEVDKYTGIDVSEKAIKVARDKHPDYDFEEIGSGMDFDEGSYAYVIASGIFTLHAADWDDVVKTTVDTMYNICAKEVRVNFLRGDSHTSPDGTYQLTTEDHVRKILSKYKNIDCIGDYLPGDSDFTIAIKKS